MQFLLIAFRLQMFSRAFAAFQRTRSSSPGPRCQSSCSKEGYGFINKVLTIVGSTRTSAGTDRCAHEEGIHHSITWMKLNTKDVL
ncbi:hypothetical protein ACHQM5_025451 [Ranunculus cassubicifolius]